MVLAIPSVFGFCARKAQKPKHKKITYRSAEGEIADRVSRESDN
jgi:hypothetical protein